MAEKIKLNDEELDKVNGGYTFAITSLDGGDVFVCRDSPNIAFVIATDIIIENNNTIVQFYDAFKSENGWKKVAYLNEEKLEWILRIADYSRELSGTIFC